MIDVITTADDFGLDIAVNEAVEQAHRDGILTSTSLMVGGPAAADAVARARRLPTLRVGLHLALVDAIPLLPPPEIAGLVGCDGEFRRDQGAAGVDFYLRPSVRAQLRREIAAQFAAFARTGLTLDHVNAHKHMHVHPTVARLIIEIGRDYRLRSVRLPSEPAPIIRALDPADPPGWAVRLWQPWVGFLRRRLRAAGLRTNDRVFGLHWSGRMTGERLLGLLPRLPATGLTEIYFHPAAERTADLARRMPDYRHVEELVGLLDPRVRAQVAALGIHLTSFGAVAP
ncbi:MAG: hopanoid biosynthesis-associated protein HpnK [Azospirillaceae bacterium]|nr:hopanoid biosynthesis-associated protein HpnK [Azospirillaceae bacterium]